MPSVQARPNVAACAKRYYHDWDRYDPEAEVGRIEEEAHSTRPLNLCLAICGVPSHSFTLA